MVNDHTLNTRGTPAKTTVRLEFSAARPPQTLALHRTEDSVRVDPICLAESSGRIPKNSADTPKNIHSREPLSCNVLLSRFDIRGGEGTVTPHANIRTPADGRYIR